MKKRPRFYNIALTGACVCTVPQVGRPHDEVVSDVVSSHEAARDHSRWRSCSAAGLRSCETVDATDTAFGFLAADPQQQVHPVRMRTRT